MEIVFENKSQRAYREIYHQTKRIQESAESVVPDTDEDIGRVASVQTGVLLKSKDVTARGVTVTGEASASLIYITEDQQKSAFVSLTRGFTIEYEAADLDQDTVAQVKLRIASCQARVVNPRKVSVTFDISGELSCYRQEDMIVSSALPQPPVEGLHARTETVELVAVSAACEKTFAINEQFSFPGGKPAPSRLVSAGADIQMGESQLIGSKVIVKGSAKISAIYLSQEAPYPIQAEFSTPFSQILDIGEESMEGCQIHIELSSAYYDIVSTINNDKALDVELHAVLQLVSRSRRRIEHIADAYSNLMPAKLSRSSFRYELAAEQPRQKLSADERISVGEDCADVLSAFLSIARAEQEQSKLSLGVRLDLVYRDQAGLLSAVSRTIAMETELGQGETRLWGVKLSDVYIRPDGQYVDVHLSTELSWQTVTSLELEKVSAITLDEDSAYDLSAFPTLTLVRQTGEELWELAKKYHSSVEKIQPLEGQEQAPGGRLLLIPKAI